MVGLACLLGGLPDDLPLLPVQRHDALRSSLKERDFPLALTELLLAMTAPHPSDRLSVVEAARHARRMIADSPGQWLEDFAPRVVPQMLGQPAPENITLPADEVGAFPVLPVVLASAAAGTFSVGALSVLAVVMMVL